VHQERPNISKRVSNKCDAHSTNSQLTSEKHLTIVLLHACSLSVMCSSQLRDRCVCYVCRASMHLVACFQWFSSSRWIRNRHTLSLVLYFHQSMYEVWLALLWSVVPRIFNIHTYIQMNSEITCIPDFPQNKVWNCSRNANIICHTCRMMLSHVSVARVVWSPPDQPDGRDGLCLFASVLYKVVQHTLHYPQQKSAYNSCIIH